MNEKISNTVDKLSFCGFKSVLALLKIKALCSEKFWKITGNSVLVYCFMGPEMI